MRGPSALLIVGLRSAGPVSAFFAGLARLGDEIQDLNLSVVLINDAPEDDELAEALRAELPPLAGRLNVSVFSNVHSLGPILVANHGLRMARALGCDALLWDPQTELLPGVLREVIAVSQTDPLIAIVSPRSNVGQICGSPPPRRFRRLGRDKAIETHQSFSARLPRITYTPTNDGVCFYVRHPVLAEFGVFDPAYGDDRAAVADFIFRCNRRGYRSVLANRAFAYHPGAAPADKGRESAARALLTTRYPEFDRSLRRYFNGPEFRAQTVMAGLLAAGGQKPRILFDCRYLRAHHNGTAEHTRQLIRAFVREHSAAYDCFVCGEAEGLAFHELDQIPHLVFCNGKELEMAPFSAVFRCAQPFGIDDLVLLSDLAPVTAFLMLDTIAMDCQNLDEQGLEYIWRQMLDTADAIGFNSAFTRDQFQSRFAIPECITTFVSLCSTDEGEYPSLGGDFGEPTEGYILIVGNHYSHKHAAAALAALDQLADRPPVVCFGVEVPSDRRTTSVKAGDLSPEAVERLYAQAAVLLFPSHYEGFGLPVMHALAHRKPVVARRLPVFEEIQRRTPYAANMILCDTTEQMVREAAALPAWREEGASIEPVQTWALAADALAQAVSEAVDRVTYVGLTRKFERIHSLRALLKAGVPHPGALTSSADDLAQA